MKKTPSAKTHRNAAKAVRKSAKPLPKAAKSHHKPAKALPKAGKPLRTAAKALPKAGKSVRKAAKGLPRAVRVLLNSAKPYRELAKGRRGAVLTAPEPASMLDGSVLPPVARYRPEYLGDVFVLSRHSLDYAPANEAEFLIWAQSYIDAASTLIPAFPNVFSGTAKYPLHVLESLLINIRGTVRDVLRLADLHSAWNAFKNIQIYAREHDVAVSPPPPAQPPIGNGITTMPRVGLMGMIDFQVRLLRETPGFKQTHADLLGIVPRAPGSGDLAQLYANLRARNLGGNRVRLSWHSAASIAGIMGAILRVNRGDGRWVDLAVNTTIGHFMDTTMQPEEPGVWTYALFYVDETGGQIGQVSEVSITVSAAAVVIHESNLNQHK